MRRVPKPTGQVIVVGSINIDLVVRVHRLPGPGETVGGGSFERHGGGKGANQAVAAARAGAHVHMVGAVGDDDFGTGALEELRAAGVDVGGVSRLGDAETGVATITVDAEGENQIAVASGANHALRADAVRNALDGIPVAPGAALLLSFELGDPPLQAAAAWARHAGVGVVIVNPAPARALSEALLAAHPLLTPNRGELAQLCPAGAGTLSARTGAAVIVTRGREGALLADADRCETHPAPPMRAVDTTGAGDAFNGALAAALAQGYQLSTAARRAVAAASASVRERGARGGLPTREEIDALTASPPERER